MLSERLASMTDENRSMKMELISLRSNMKSVIDAKDTRFADTEKLLASRDREVDHLKSVINIKADEFETMNTEFKRFKRLHNSCFNKIVAPNNPNTCLYRSQTSSMRSMQQFDAENSVDEASRLVK